MLNTWQSKKSWSREWSKNPHAWITWLESIWLCDLGSILFERIILNDFDDFNFVRFISLWSYRRSPLVVQYLNVFFFTPCYLRTCNLSATRSMTQNGTAKRLEDGCKYLEQQITTSWNYQLCDDWLKRQLDQSGSIWFQSSNLLNKGLFGVILRSWNVTQRQIRRYWTAYHWIASCSTTCYRVKSTLKNPFINTSYSFHDFSGVLWSGRKFARLN